MVLCSMAIGGAVVGLAALIRGLVHRRRCGHGGHGHYGRGRGFGRSYWLRALFSRLDTTPGQEREIRSALEEFKRVATEAKSDLAVAREDVARAVRSEAFDEIAIGDAQVKADNSTLKVKQAFEAALRRIHAILDSEQRERLGDLLSRGLGGFVRSGGPYRGPAAS